MASMPTVRLAIDGEEYTIQLAQGDYVRAERDGHTFSADMPASHVAMACVTFHAISRLRRRGEITADLPSDFEDFLDVFDFPDDQPEMDDPEGNGSAPEATTGS